MSNKSDFSKVYHSGTAKQSKSIDPCSAKKNADCIGSCHLEVNEYGPSQFKHLSNQQKLKNLQLFGAKNIKSVGCKSRHGRNLAAKAASRSKQVSVRSKRSKPTYAGSQYCPKFAGRYAGGGKDSCEAARRPDGRSCLWVKKGRKCRVKAQRKIYTSKYQDPECNSLSKKKNCDGKFGKNLGCKWYKSRKSPKSKKNSELYGHKGCWSSDPSKYGGESNASSMRAAQKLLARDFVVPAGSCQGLAVSAGSVNDAYHRCYSRSNCKISKKTKSGGNKLNNLRCVEIPGSYAKKRAGVFGKLRGLAASGGLASKISSSASAAPKSPVSSSSESAKTAMASGIGKADYDTAGMFDFNSKRKSKRRRRKSRKSRKSKRRRRSSKRKSKCRSCSKKKSCGKSKKFKNCNWRKSVGCVKKSRKHHFGDQLS